MRTVIKFHIFMHIIIALILAGTGFLPSLSAEALNNNPNNPQGIFYQIDLTSNSKAHSYKNRDVIVKLSIHQQISNQAHIWFEKYDRKSSKCDPLTISENLKIMVQIGSCNPIPEKLQNQILYSGNKFYLKTTITDIDNSQAISLKVIDLNTMKNLLDNSSTYGMDQDHETKILGLSFQKNPGKTKLLLNKLLGKSYTLDDSIRQSNPNVKVFTNMVLSQLKSEKSAIMYDYFTGQKRSDQPENIESQKQYDFIDYRILNLTVTQNDQTNTNQTDHKQPNNDEQKSDKNQAIEATDLDLIDENNENTDSSQKRAQENSSDSNSTESTKTLDTKSNTETNEENQEKSVTTTVQSLDSNISNILQSQKWDIDSLEVKQRATFNSDIKISGKVIFNEDSIGQAQITKDNSEVYIDFEHEYIYPPIITVTLASSSNINKYFIDEISTSGFKIKTDVKAENDTLFNWHAFASDKGKLSVSSSFIDPLYHSSCEGYSWSRGYKDSHHGVDLAIQKGCTISSIDRGTVRFAGWLDDDSGYTVIIDHDNQYSSYYLHGNGTFYVKEKDPVIKGQAIMEMGNTGKSTGTHLHFGLKKYDEWIDPADIVPYHR